MIREGMLVEIVGPSENPTQKERMINELYWSGCQNTQGKVRRVLFVNPEAVIAGHEVPLARLYDPNDKASQLWDLLCFWLKPVMQEGQISCKICGCPATPSFNHDYCSNPNCQNGKGYGCSR